MTPTHVSDERGSATVFVMLFTVALLVAAGLVIDGGHAMAERRKLSNQADQAARVGADALDEADLRNGGTPDVDPDRARAAATAYLSEVGATGATGATVTVRGGEVTVTLKGHAKTSILSVAGIDDIPVAGSGTAESIDEDT